MENASTYRIAHFVLISYYKAPCASGCNLATCNLLRLRGLPILQQLRLEEAILRADKRNWCIINDGSPSPAIVMGISGKKDELIHTEAAKKAGIEVIKRFSGGGTVVVDHNTIFATLIMQAEAVPGVECHPRPIMQWSEGFYKNVFGPHGNFSLQEHDYTFGEQKFGGNAQAITKQRWLHHTSFLWDFDDRNMALLKHPSRVPKYRMERDHSAFICRLRDYMPREALIKGIEHALETANLALKEVTLEEASMLTQLEYIKNTRTIDL